MLMAGSAGADLNIGDDNLHAAYFGESQGRYLVAVEDGASFVAEAKSAGLEARIIGETTDDAVLKLGDADTISVTDLAQAFEKGLPEIVS